MSSKVLSQVTAATASAAPKASVPTAQSKVLRQRYNELAAAHFAAACLAFIALFVIFRVIGVLTRRRKIERAGSVVKGISTTSRRARSIFIRRIFGFPTVGHAVIYVLYIMVNIILAFYNVDWSVGTLNNWAKRMGWVTLFNIALVTFLSLRNTPLAFLTAYSYERLNVLHRLAGYTVVGSMLIHGIVYTKAFAVSGDLHELLELDNVMGWVAGLSLLIILATSLLLRALRYEIFYIVHVVFFMLIIIAVGLHRPVVSKNAVWIPTFAGVIWVLDRAIRSGRLIYYAPLNSANIYPLPHGGTRIVLSRTSVRAVPGSHLFLWLPKIRLLETHPFTISTAKPTVELIVKAHDGFFTRSLYQHALKRPGAKLRASLDGPYGTLPNFLLYDRIVLIAGGSGASFTFGVAVDLVRRWKSNGGSSEAGPRYVIEFIWVVKEIEMLTWFTSELQILLDAPNVNLNIHVTNHHGEKSSSGSAPLHLADLESGSSKGGSLNEKSSEIGGTKGGVMNFTCPVDGRLDVENRSRHNTTAEPSSPSSSSTSSASAEKSDADIPSSNVLALPTGLAIRSGRPNVKQVIRDIIVTGIDAETSDSRSIVSACGPVSLMRDTREEVVSILASGRRSVELHVESFGW